MQNKIIYNTQYGTVKLCWQIRDN